MKEKPSTAGCVFALVWFPLLMVALSIYHGFVLVQLWRWFIIPTFHAPALSLPAAIGLSLIVGFMAKDHSSGDSDADRTFWESIAYATMKAAILPTMTLTSGWIVSHYM